MCGGQIIRTCWVRGCDVMMAIWNVVIGRWSVSSPGFILSESSFGAGTETSRQCGPGHEWRCGVVHPASQVQLTHCISHNNIYRIDNAQYIGSSDPHLDLAILSLCHHTVIDFGTFGVWVESIFCCIINLLNRRVLFCQVVRWYCQTMLQRELLWSVTAVFSTGQSWQTITSQYQLMICNKYIWAPILLLREFNTVSSLLSIDTRRDECCWTLMAALNCSR